MVNEKSLAWGRRQSYGRALAAYGERRKAEIGADKVFDFCVGHACAPTPDRVNETLRSLLRETDGVTLHGYTPAPGLPAVRQAIADDCKARYGADLDADGIYVCCGAAAGLTCCVRALVSPGEKLFVFAPFYPEYRMFAELAGAELVVLPPREDLRPDLDALEQALDDNSGAVLLCSFHSPAGVTMHKEDLQRLGGILKAAEARIGRPVYLISDETGRELFYDGSQAPCLFSAYDDSALCYGFDGALSLGGEQLAYVAIGNKMAEKEKVFASVAGVARACGYVNPPSLMQRAVARCLDVRVDLSACRETRDLLCKELQSLGFACLCPETAYGLFLKAPGEDGVAFSEQAKQHELLLVPGEDFGVNGFVQLNCGVSPDTARRALPAFAALAADYGLNG